MQRNAGFDALSHALRSGRGVGLAVMAGSDRCDGAGIVIGVAFGAVAWVVLVGFGLLSWWLL